MTNPRDGWHRPGAWPTNQESTLDEASSTCPTCECVPDRWIRGNCAKCYDRLRAAGRIKPLRKTTRIDFEAWLASVIGTDGCWLWPGGKYRDGYGRVQIRGKRERVHRIVYRRLVGPLPKGTEPDHLCRNRACANPAHLDPVIHRVNVLRGEAPPAHHARKTRCPSGHPYSGANLYVRPGNGTRLCKTCQRAHSLVSNRRWRAKRAC